MAERDAAHWEKMTRELAGALVAALLAAENAEVTFDPFIAEGRPPDAKHVRVTVNVPPEIMALAEEVRDNDKRTPLGRGLRILPRHAPHTEGEPFQVWVEFWANPAEWEMINERRAAALGGGE